MQDIRSKVEELSERLSKLKEGLNLPQKKERLTILSAEAGDVNLWKDPEKAKKTLQELSSVTKELKEVDQLTATVSAIKNLAEVAQAEKDIERLELVSFLADEYDEKNAIVGIHAGQGGTEAMDWANMLLRMYLRFCEKRHWETNIIDQSVGTEAGLKSVSFEVKGRYVYGYLKTESGVHRLVRLSPFDADHARHTSFAMVEAVPELESKEMEIKDEDLKIETNTSTGHGGQSVNTTYSAIRLTHIPTGLKVSCQNERSQHQNKETALNYLKGKLAKYNEAQADEERMRLRGELTEAAWGNQIRSYVLHPYKMVKDHRTDYEEHEPDKVLDGGIDNFIEVYLRSKIV